MDEEPEAIVWYIFDTIDGIGTALWFDQQCDNWHLLGEVGLDFWRDQNPPRIDSDIPALLIYSYGWGSGYGAQFLHFIQYHDSIVEVMSMIESEGLYMMNYGPILRYIKGDCSVLNDTSLVVHYTYKVECNEDGEHYEDVIFEEKIDIPYFWNPVENVFQAKPPAGISPTAFEGFWTGEGTLDSYFEPQLDKIKREGLEWKRKALGSSL